MVRIGALHLFVVPRIRCRRQIGLRTPRPGPQPQIRRATQQEATRPIVFIDRLSDGRQSGALSISSMMARSRPRMRSAGSDGRGLKNRLRDRLRANGLFREITSWKLRRFVPIDTSARPFWRRCWSASAGLSSHHGVGGVRITAAGGGGAGVLSHPGTG